MNRRFITNIIQVLIGALVGFFMGYFIMDILSLTTFGLDVLIYYVIFVVLAFIIHMIAHEAGHMLFGILGGFEFVSFRIGSYMWVNDQGVIKFTRYRLAGTSGQCLMLPTRNEFSSYVLYNLGGGLMNLIVSFVFFLLALLIPDTLFRIFSVCMVMAGVLFGLFNLIPFDAGVPNDGYNLLCLFKDRRSMESMRQQLVISKELADGKRLDEMDESLFKLYEGANLENPLNTCIQSNYATRLLTMKKYDEVKPILLELKRLRLSDVFAKSVSVDLALVRLLSEDLSNFLTGVEEKWMKTLEKERSSVYSLVLLYGIELLVHKDEEAALIYLKYYKDACEKYPYQGVVSETDEIVGLLQERKNGND